MIFAGQWRQPLPERPQNTNEHPTRQQRVEAEEDRAEQAALDVMRQRATDAWAAATTPMPWIDESREQAIDSRAESRHEQDNHEYAELMMRELDERW